MVLELPVTQPPTPLTDLRASVDSRLVKPSGFVEPIDEHFLRTVEDMRATGRSRSTTHLRPGSRHSSRPRSRVATSTSRPDGSSTRGGFYTIGSAGHESNAAVGLLSRTTDPALLHYRSGGFYAARRRCCDGTVDPVRESLRGLTGSAADPMSGGRHKVFGHPSCTSSRRPRRSPRTCRARSASASPWDSRRRWAGDAVAGGRAGRRQLRRRLGEPLDGGRCLNAAAYLTHVHRDCPLLLVCEDNGLGISTRTPRGWPAAVLQHLPGIAYFQPPATTRRPARDDRGGADRRTHAGARPPCFT